MHLDTLILGFDRALRTIAAPGDGQRTSPDERLAEGVLSEAERRHAARLMRVNHSGEVCAQALYQGQAVTCRTPALRSSLAQAADEELEHLAWTERRIASLGGRKSLLNPLWYAGSFALGALAGRAGDAWNLGFLAETERQVEAHLNSHLRRLPVADARSRAVVTQMRDDEAAHAEMALQLGGRALPFAVRASMRLAAGVMTRLTHWV